MAEALPGVLFSNFATTTPSFNLVAGVYMLAASGTWNSGSLALAKLGPDGSTYLTVGTALSANGTAQPLYCPTGTYQLVVTGSPSALYAQVARVQLTGPG